MNKTSVSMPPFPNQGRVFLAYDRDPVPYGKHRLVKYHVDPEKKKPWWEDASTGETLKHTPMFWSELPKP